MREVRPSRVRFRRPRSTGFHTRAVASVADTGSETWCGPPSCAGPTSDSGSSLHGCPPVAWGRPPPGRQREGVEVSAVTLRWLPQPDPAARALLSGSRRPVLASHMSEDFGHQPDLCAQHSGPSGGPLTSHLTGAVKTERRWGLLTGGDPLLSLPLTPSLWAPKGGQGETRRSCHRIWTGRAGE